MNTPTTTLDEQPTLTWSDDLVMNMDKMDQTHREFVDLLAATELAPEDKLIASFIELIAHTDEHFTGENQWMQDVSFGPGGCHTDEHDMILKVMREALRRGQEDGNLQMVRQLTGELAVWFDGHAKSMDAVLAMFLKEVAYDPVTRIVHKPQVLPEGVAAGECGVPLDEAAPQV
ncbi:MAG: hemerythrin domain-containing protein [Methylotenera sp.]|nr:hemerythrin domain-containing protein [Methylotenera sp.]